MCMNQKSTFMISFLSIYLSLSLFLDEIRADLVSRKVGTALAGLTADFPENQVLYNKINNNSIYYRL